MSGNTNSQASHDMKLGAIIMAIAIVFTGYLGQAVGCAAPADTAAAAPADKPGDKPADKPADAVVVVEKSLNIESPVTAQDWLARAAKKHESIKTLTAKVNWLRIQGLIGDEQRRTGTLTAELGDSSKFAVHFDRLIFGRRSKKQNRWYIFDGKWLVEKIIDDDNGKKQFFKWQVVPPNAKPGQANPLAVGQGPFAVPVPVNRQVINERFNVTLVASEKNDEAKLVQLKLKPNQKYKDIVKFTEMDIWYDRDSMIPAKVRSIDASENESEFSMKNVEVGKQLKAGTFDTAEPKEKGWEVSITPWGK